MASIFTFDPDPPRVASPWRHLGGPSLEIPPTAESVALDASPNYEKLDYRTTKLEAEPQDGPVEYKLHLLLRPRRRLSASSTVLHVSGSHQSKPAATTSVAKSAGTTQLPSFAAPTSQSKHNRLQSLTTQLLWRLQQSSPFHSPSKSVLVIPTIWAGKEDTLASDGPRGLLPGLEESHGALYEIGVSDDGTLVGLTKDELEESLSTLSIMASSLGCRVDVLRRVTVGNCQWTEENHHPSKPIKIVHDEPLWVAEAQVVPVLKYQKPGAPSTIPEINDATQFESDDALPNTLFSDAGNQSEQMRVSLTGSTTSGKSSLLGTLSTSTHDNGRGKSRLSLLKHRHEISSGITSSIVTELIGYKHESPVTGTSVINFATGNVSSWNDIHSTCDVGRLVVLTDSAGHPRYRRTTVRGLMSWAPHWTICCVAADDDEHNTGKTGATTSSQDVLGSTGAGIDLTRSHLELCLRLDLSLVVVITKLDLASSAGLRETLKKVLTILKAAGRQPVVLSTNKSSEACQRLQWVSEADESEVADLVKRMDTRLRTNIVPIILTSAVTGAGICQLHTLLRQLPIVCAGANSKASQTKDQESNGPEDLFHIDEVFTTSVASSIALLDGSRSINGHILSGHLSYGTLHIGDIIFVGPFSGDPDTENFGDHKVHQTKSCPVLEGSSTPATKQPVSRHYSPGNFDGSDSGPPTNESYLDSPAWRKVRVVSLRNLRLPVRHLQAGQVGTVGVAYEDVEHPMVGESIARIASAFRIRKGMVLLHGSTDFMREQPLSYRGFKALFDSDRISTVPIRSSVIVYIASIRASAKILSVHNATRAISHDEIFSFDNCEADDVHAGKTMETNHEPEETEVAFGFLASREWFECGKEVLVMPERADAGGAGLEGIVGIIKEPLCSWLTKV